jgi:hypothetical protein
MGVTHPENNAVLCDSEDGETQWESFSVMALHMVRYRNKSTLRFGDKSGHCFQAKINVKTYKVRPSRQR